MSYSKLFYSRKSNSLKETSKTLYEGFFESSGEGYETVKYDAAKDRYITYYLYHQIRVFHKDDWTIEINIGPFASMIARLADLIFWNNFTESSIRYAFRGCPVLTEYLLNHYEYKGEHIMCFDWDKNSEDFGQLTILLSEYGRNLSYTSKIRYINLLVEFADKAIEELSQLKFNPNDLDFVKSSSGGYKQSKPLPQWIRDAQRLGIRIGARILSAYIGGALSNIDIPDVDFGNADVPDVDLSNFDFNFDVDFDSEDFDISDYDFGDSDLSFRGIKTDSKLPPNANSDGYIPKGKISLERVISGITDKFDLFKKDGAKYVLYGGDYIKISGTSDVVINGIRYNT